MNGNGNTILSENIYDLLLILNIFLSTAKRGDNVTHFIWFENGKPITAKLETDLHSKLWYLFCQCRCNLVILFCFECLVWWARTKTSKEPITSLVTWSWFLHLQDHCTFMDIWVIGLCTHESAAIMWIKKAVSYNHRINGVLWCPPPCSLDKTLKLMERPLLGIQNSICHPCFSFKWVMEMKQNSLWTCESCTYADLHNSCYIMTPQEPREFPALCSESL